MPFDPNPYSPTPVALDADGEVRAVYARAADYLEKNGWTKCVSAFWPRTCVRGALAWALGYEPHSPSDVGHINDYHSNPLSRVAERGLGVGVLSNWNDSLPRETGKDIVISRLREAAYGGRG